MTDYKLDTKQQEVSAVDIHTMFDMTPEQYRRFIEDSLIYVDHHDVLRSMAAGYPLAVTRQQFAILMEYLKEIGPSVGTSWERDR